MFAAGLAFLVVLFAAGIVAAAFNMPADTPVTFTTLPAEGAIASAEVSPSGKGMQHPGGNAMVHARMHVALPDSADGQTPWVVVLNRDLYDEIHLASGGWRSEVRSFFRPDINAEGGIPSFFVFTLPAHLRGDIQLDVVARRATPGMVRPFVMPEGVVRKMEHRTIAMSTAVYSGLFVLALVMLSLFYAARDSAFLSYFAFAIAALLLLAAVNGHLYLLPGFGLLGAWGEQGLNVLAMLFSASALNILLRYADTATGSPRLNAVTRYLCVALLAISGLALVNLPVLGVVVQSLTLLGWISAAVVCIVIAYDAARRGVPMAWPVTALCVLNLASALGAELLARGVLPDVWWIRRGYQLSILMSAAVIAVGLASRIGNYRDQRDRARLAREDSELRATRQSARLSLAEGLQAQLKHLPQSDVAWTAYRRVIDHLLPMLQLQSLAVAVYGGEAQDFLLVEPAERRDRVSQAISKRHVMLKALARTRAPLQISLHDAVAGAAPLPQSALVPLPLHAPAWGVMILERSDGDGFTTDELTLASEFGRLATEAVEEANASMRLRRSAELDALTGTLNRRTLDQWLTRCFADAHRAGHDLSVLFVDLDHFKRVNDTHGHAAGDHCLRRTSAALREVLGPGDFLGRYGGEEFMIVLPAATSDAARRVGEAIRTAVETLPIEWDGNPLTLTVSVGVATRWPHEQGPTTTIARADKALYAAKRAGRNRVHVAPAEFF